jgi:ketosteroid isomerase-like protein
MAQRTAWAAALIFASAAIAVVAPRLNGGAEKLTMNIEPNAPSGDTETRAVIGKFNAAFNQQDPDAVAALLTEDTVFEDTSPQPDGTRLEGKAAVVAFWREWFKKNPGAQFEAEDTIVCGSRAVVRWTYHKVRNGQPWHLRGVDVFTVRDGKVAAKLAYVKG